MIDYLFVIFLVLLTFFLCYSVIPTLVIRLFNIGITKKMEGGKGIALTFDDGPDSIYTVQLLDLLKRYNIKATFFVVGSRAEKNPEILKRMHREGHTIGIHHYEHVSSWRLTPKRLNEQLNKTKKVIETCTNEEVKFYRPPWGRFNLFSLMVSKPYKVIMWSDIFGDWKIATCKKMLLQQLRHTQAEGNIVLLHDNGENPGADDQAPMYMLEQLAIYVEECKKKDVHFITLKESLSGR
ncbi:MAG: polysaccharide deacetylase family protein [Bacillus sp. (in: firmicutes)]